MIKYRVNGQLLSNNGEVQNVCSDIFEDHKDPFNARNQARKYLNNFINLLHEDFNIDFQTTFHEIKKIEFDGKTHEIPTNYKIAIEYAIDDEDYHEIDAYGILDNTSFDFFATALKEEFFYYSDNNLDYENAKEITYCDFVEWIDGNTDEQPSTFKILPTTIDFSKKDKPYWWLTKEEKIQIIKNYRRELRIEKAFKYGENNFVEFKPALVYNFKTQRGSIRVKKIIAKVICSFLNTNGGILLIGMNDDGSIQGLDADFSLATKENEFDFFRNEFDNMLFQFFERNVFHYIHADFDVSHDKPFFKVAVKPSEAPVFLINKKENRKEFYIRTATSSIQIFDMEDAVKYCMTHWGK